MTRSPGPENAATGSHAPAERAIEQLAARTQLSGEQTVVDVGTGTGFVAAGLAAHTHRVLGFDNASSMLQVARANVDRLGVDNVELAEGDVADLPLADHAVDATVANMVLAISAMHPAAMLVEMTRITRPGGWVAITDEIEHPYEWMRTSDSALPLRLPGSSDRGLLR